MTVDFDDALADLTQRLEVQLGAAPPAHLSTRATVLLGGKQPKYVEVTRAHDPHHPDGWLGRLVAFTTKRVISIDLGEQGELEPSERSATACTIPRSALESIELLGRDADWAQSLGPGGLSQLTQIRLRYSTGLALDLPLDPSSAERRERVWGLVPALLTDLEG